METYEVVTISFETKHNTKNNIFTTFQELHDLTNS